MVGAQKLMSNAAEIRALVVTPDAALASTFVNVSRELGITTQVSDPRALALDALSREKYEAMMIDIDAVQDPAAALTGLRANPSNRGAVIFAVASAHGSEQAALNSGANFVLVRPLDTKQLRRTLYAAYEAMTQERRRYFRCSAELPVFLTRGDGSDLVAKTGNVSTNGMSILSSSSFALGERVGIALQLESTGPHVLARGVVVWDDKHGKTGISFHCVRPELQGVLDAWLDDQFRKTREAAILELQREGSATARN